jgi:isoquinoline 1-oxidoreductase beta subunit
MTGGSTTTPSEFDRYRQAGATARALLVQAAAQRFGVNPADCRTENGVVIAGKQRARYGKLAGAAAKLPPLKEVSLKDPKDWKLIGKPMKRLDTPEKITGRAEFGMDVRLPGMLTAVVAHPPVFGGKVKSFDAGAARAVPGVRRVLQVATGVAVVADRFWAAKLGREALKIDWDLGPNESLDSTALREQFSAGARTSPPISWPRRSRLRRLPMHPSKPYGPARTMSAAATIARPFSTVPASAWVRTACRWRGSTP